MGADRFRVALLWLAALSGAAMSLHFTLSTLALGGFRPDFTVFWTAARFWFERPGDLYDVAAITAAQDHIVGKELARPWVYPPSALPWVSPLALLPVWPAMFAWCASTGLGFGAAGLALTRDWRAVALSFLAPAMAMQMIAGQTALLLGGLVLAACVLLKDRPWLAGLLFGLAATIKPQAVILVPLALIVSRQWPALFASGVTGVVVGGLSYVAAPQLWWDWIEALRAFPAIVEALGLPRRSLGASGLVAVLDLEGTAAILAWALVVGLGVSLVAICWWKTEDLRLRAAALLCGSLLLSPYAMGYDGAALALVGFSLLLDRRLAPRLWAAGLLMTMAGNAILTVGAAALLLTGLTAARRSADSRSGSEKTAEPSAQQEV